MKKTTLMLMAAALMTAGCAKMRNEIAANGGFFTSHEGNYVIRNDSGGKIMDVWILKNCMVQSTESGSGWLFRDNDGNAIHLGGDVKIVRVIGDFDMKSYHEYHAEFEVKPYQELYGK